MELRQLRYFLAVADELSFTRAAAACNVSQPPLSRAIAQLEGQIGARLFDRDRHGVSLTPAGLSLAEDARRIIGLAERGSDRARRVAEGLEGVLTVALGGTAAYALLPAMVRRFRRAAPDVQIVFKAMSVPAQIDALRDREIDIGLLRLPVHDELLSTRFVYREPLSLALPVSHPLLDSPGAIRLEQLAGHRLVTYEPRRGFNYHADLRALCRLTGFDPVIAHEASTTEAIIGIVACGEGVALVPNSARRLRMRGVTFRRICGDSVPERLRQVEFGLAWRTDSRSPSTAKMVALMRRRGRTRRGPVDSCR